MNIIDVITKKRDGKDLSKADIDFFITAMMNEDITDYHVAALLMACYINGLTDDETFFLTNALLKSGETLKFNDKPYFSRMVDKHSTGGIGDKTTLIVIPMVASLGVKCAKQSGRGLGFTGGTADKLMSIPGFNTNLSSDKFLEAVEKVGAALITQTADISPADKKLYALRDSTATADNTSLIASSIMSKKLASGCNNILLDVKCGSGAFAGEFEDAKKLANLMVKIGGVLPDASRMVIQTLEDMGAICNIRMAIRKDGPVITDNGNFLIDAKFSEIESPSHLEIDLNSIPGVVENGIFSQMVDKVIIGTDNGTYEL